MYSCCAGCSLGRAGLLSLLWPFRAPVPTLAYSQTHVLPCAGAAAGPRAPAPAPPPVATAAAAAAPLAAAAGEQSSVGWQAFLGWLVVWAYAAGVRAPAQLLPMGRAVVSKPPLAPLPGKRCVATAGGSGSAVTLQQSSRPPPLTLPSPSPHYCPHVHCRSRSRSPARSKSPRKSASPPPAAEGDA